MRCSLLVVVFKCVSLVLLHSIAQQFVTVPEIIRKYGYPAESHQVVTEDGYILTLHRIPYSPMSPAAPNKPAVLLHHGLLSTSFDWVAMGPEKSLGYLLADTGYDVWLANSRGNTYSTNHTTLSTSSQKFWDFSWHEMGVYDLPAEIDYILNITDQYNLYYVGMSMGTTIFFVFASERPEYNPKIRLMIAEAPVVFMDKISNARAINDLIPVGLKLLQSMGINGIRRGRLNDFLPNVCGHNTLKRICSDILYFIGGHDAKQLNESMLPFLSTYFPDGASLKSFKHYLQLINTGTFQQYDYGEKLNIMKYKQRVAPHYNLNAVTARIVLIYATNDALSSVDNVLQLNRILPNCVELYKIPYSFFTHFEYIIAIDVKILVNDEVIKIIKKY